MQTQLISARVFGGLRDHLLEKIAPEDLTAAFRASRLPEPSMYAPDRFMPLKTLFMFLENIVRQSGDREYSLRFGPSTDIRKWGVWGAYGLAGATLLESMLRIARVQRYHASGDRIYPQMAGNELRLIYQCSAVSTIGYRHYSVAAMCAMINLSRTYLGRDWTPLRVEFDFAEPRSDEPFGDLFHCPVLFGRASLTLAIDRDQAREGCLVPGAQITTTSDILRRMVAPPTDVVGIARELIRLHLLDGEVDVERIAEQMNLGLRTLQRRLSDEGVNARALVSQVRAERAGELLRGTDASIIDIALELGYSSTSHFSRAFQKTTGALPSDLRRRGAT